MPYKDKEKARNREYYLSHRDDLKLRRRKRYQQKKKTKSVHSPKSVQSQDHINVQSQDDEKSVQSQNDKKSPTLDDVNLDDLIE